MIEGAPREATDYDSLQAVMRRVAEERGMSRDSLDELAGLPKGLASKTLSSEPTRRLGSSTMGPLLQALGLKLLVVDDPVALAKFTSRGAKRDEKEAKKATKHTAAVHVRVTHRFLKKIAKKGGANSRKFISRREASALGKKAARARWWKKSKSRVGADTSTVT